MAKRIPGHRVGKQVLLEGVYKTDSREGGRQGERGKRELVSDCVCECVGEKVQVNPAIQMVQLLDGTG